MEKNPRERGAEKPRLGRWKTLFFSMLGALAFLALAVGAAAAQVPAANEPAGEGSPNPVPPAADIPGPGTAGKAADQEEEIAFSQAELDQMLAPIALYPDSLLAQILVAATYPLEVVAAHRWSEANPELEGQEAVEAVAEKEWDPSVKALVAFPNLLARMDEDLEWTQRLGDAFLVQEEEVLGTIQALRKRADEAGNLTSLDHLDVRREREVIYLQPANPRVVYVPYYRSTVVYGDWWWSSHPPVYWGPPVSSYAVYYSGGTRFVWSRGYRVAPSYFHRTCDWPRRQIVVVREHHHHHDTRFRTGSGFVSHDGVQRWRHEPAHRRGVSYRSEALKHRYGRWTASRVVDTPIVEPTQRDEYDRRSRGWRNHSRSGTRTREMLASEERISSGARRHTNSRNPHEDRERTRVRVTPPPVIHRERRDQDRSRWRASEGVNRPVPPVRADSFRSRVGPVGRLPTSRAAERMRNQVAPERVTARAQARQERERLRGQMERPAPAFRAPPRAQIQADRSWSRSARPRTSSRDASHVQNVTTAPPPPPEANRSSRPKTNHHDGRAVPRVPARLQREISARSTERASAEPRVERRSRAEARRSPSADPRRSSGRNRRAPSGQDAPE